MLKDFLDWPHLQQVFKLECHAVELETGQVYSYTHYGLTSLSAADASLLRLLALKCHYWGIETCFIIDVMFVSMKIAVACAPVTPPKLWPLSTIWFWPLLTGLISTPFLMLDVFSLLTRSKPSISFFNFLFRLCNNPTEILTP